MISSLCCSYNKLSAILRGVFPCLSLRLTSILGIDNNSSTNWQPSQTWQGQTWQGQTWQGQTWQGQMWQGKWQTWQAKPDKHGKEYDKYGKVEFSIENSHSLSNKASSLNSCGVNVSIWVGLTHYRKPLYPLWDSYLRSSME